MKKQLFALSLALAIPSLALAQAAKDASKAAAPAPASTGPVATVNGVVIPRSRADVVVKQQTARGGQDNEQMRAQVREALINNELLLQEANRSGIAKKPEVLQQIDLTRQEVIANAMVAEYVRTHPVTDADVQKEYDKAKAQTGEREYKARHILVASEDDAKGVLAELKKGGKFDEIAKKKSLDEGTRPRGGELDWNVPGNFDKSFSDALVKLDKGKMTDTPVRTRFGYHVIQLEDVRAVSFPPLQQVRQQIQQRIVGQRVDALLKDLRAKAKIE
ncbi:MAG: peptidylprolyl isomerase [Burkholderiales bacterium]